ncbi:MAG: glycosyltransferase family 9 protein [Pseudomonadales bacterium]
MSSSALSQSSLLPFSKPPATVCILRLSAIGDTTNIVPVVRAMQQQWPDCAITWVIGTGEYQLMQYLQGVEFITFDKRSGASGLLEFRQKMQGRHFDALFHMQAALRASVLSLFIKAPVRLGFDRQRAVDYQWLFSNHKIASQENAHVLDGFLAFLSAAGVNDAPLNWQFDVPDSIGDSVLEQLPDAHAFVVINACSSVRKNNWRNWPVESYKPVIDYLQKRGFTVVLTGGPADSERRIAQQINAQHDGTLINLCGQTTLGELYAVLSRARLLIAPDTGPAHMANLAATPVIGLYASSNPLRTGPYRFQECAANAYPQALHTYMGKNIEQVKWGQRVRHPNVMKLITPEDVIAKVEQVLT